MKAYYYELTKYAYPEGCERHKGTIVDGRRFYSNIPKNLKDKAANWAERVRNEKAMQICTCQQPGDARVQIREIYKERINQALLRGAGANVGLYNYSPLEQFLLDIFKNDDFFLLYIF